MVLCKPRTLVVLTALAGVLLLLPVGSALAVGTSYYVNCAAATNGNGTAASPWNNLTTVNSQTFAPGDSLLFNRGTTCTGSFVFSSSGTSTNRITIDALANLVVHHVTGGDYTAMNAKWTGLVVFAPGMVVEPNMTKGSGTYDRNSYFSNVLVDNVQAYDTTLWAGIFVWGVQIDQDHGWARDCANQAVQSRGIVIQNSTVHNTYGDGIAQFCSQNGTLQNNVVYQSGMQPAPVTTGTPVGLWWWTSENMLGQLNESYDNHSPGVDGGGYDIDYGSTNSTMQYNYGHENSTYCTSVFGYSGPTTTNIVRYNVCAGDGTVHTYLKNGVVTPMPGDSELYVCTWGGGKLVNTWIYNNTFYINSTGASAGLINFCNNGPGSDSESGGIFKNNLVTSAIAGVLGDVTTANNRTRDYNLYYYTGGTFTDPNPEAHSIYNQNPLVNGFGYDTTGRPTTQWTLQTGSPAINHGTNACTGLTGCTVGTRDFFGNAIPLGGAFDIGADEAQ